jgi:D-proline reductase (dithiol) PrdB
VLSFSSLKNQAIAKVTTRFPSLAEKFIDGFSPVEPLGGVPWCPPKRPLAQSKVALVTTAGVHHRDQRPFDMKDPDGDPSFRVIDASSPLRDLMVTHDYYDHSDADRDINIVFPIERLWELEKEGLIGEVARTHYGFMGHILGRHIQTLLNLSAPEAAKRLKLDDVDIVLLTPG